MLLSKNAQTNSSEPESLRVVTNPTTESEEQSESPWFIQGPELNCETESEQNATEDHTPEINIISDNDSPESEINLEQHSTQQNNHCGNHKKFNTTETNLLKQDTAGNVATLKTDTKDLTHRLLSLRWR